MRRLTHLKKLSVILGAAVLLSAALIASVPAHAEEGITVTSATELKNAVQNASAPLTINLGGDIFTTTVSAGTDKDITINMNGHRIRTASMYALVTAGKLTVNGGTVVNEAVQPAGCIQVNSGGTLVLNGTALDGGSMVLDNHGTSTVTDSTITASLYYGVTNQTSGILYLNGSSLISDELMAGISNYGALYFNSGIVKSKGTAIEQIRGSSLILPDGKIDKNGTDGGYHTCTLTDSVITGAVNGGTPIDAESIEDLIRRSKVSAAHVTRLEITEGTVTSDDWKYLSTDKDNTGAGNPLSRLEVLIIGQSVSQVSDMPADCFWGDRTLTEIKIFGVKVIGDHAFQHCTALETAIFPDLQSMGKDMLEGCTSMQTLGVPSTPPVCENGWIYTSSAPAGLQLQILDSSGIPLSGAALNEARIRYALALENGSDREDGYWFGMDIGEITHTISATAGEGGKVKAPGIVLRGTDARIQIIPNPGWAAASATADGENVSVVNNEYVFHDVKEDHSLTVTFIKVKDTGTSESGNSGNEKPVFGSAKAARTGDDDVLLLWCFLLAASAVVVKKLVRYRV